MTDKDCSHTYVLAGVVWSYDGQRPGSGAEHILYEDKFFCQQCLDVQYRNGRRLGNSYEKRIEGSFPK